MLTKAFIPYKGYYSSPFARWQGSFANHHSIILGSETAKNWLKTKKYSPDIFDYLRFLVQLNRAAFIMFYGGLMGNQFNWS